MKTDDNPMHCARFHHKTQNRWQLYTSKAIPVCVASPRKKVAGCISARKHLHASAQLHLLHIPILTVRITGVLRHVSECARLLAPDRPRLSVIALSVSRTT